MAAETGRRGAEGRIAFADRGIRMPVGVRQAVALAAMHPKVLAHNVAALAVTHPAVTHGAANYSANASTRRGHRAGMPGHVRSARPGASTLPKTHVP